MRRSGGKKIKETTRCDIAVTVSVVMLHAQEAGDISETRPRNNSLVSRHARACVRARRFAVCKIAIVSVTCARAIAPARRYEIDLHVGSTATAICPANAISRNNSHRDNGAH